MDSGLGTAENPAAAEYFCWNEAAAAIGIARAEKKEEVLDLRRLEANSLAVVIVVCGNRIAVRHEGLSSEAEAFYVGF